MRFFALLFAFVSTQTTTVRQFEFGKLQVGPTIVPIYGYLMSSPFLEVTVITYGATVQSLQVRDKVGRFDDVVTGYDSIEGYINNFNYDGAMVGRYANRIGGARFDLDGTAYTLNPTSWDSNHIHGGTVGFDKKIWVGNIIENGVEMFYSSPDGEEGFPGKLDTIVTFRLISNSFKINYQSRTDKATHVSFTHHNYFNLNGHRSWGKVDNLHLTVQTRKYTATNDENVPTGEINNAQGTVMDLSSGAYLTQELLAKTPGGFGYDINYCFEARTGMKQQAILASPLSGRLLEVKSTFPGLQVYTANWVNSTGKYNIHYDKNTAVALEPQYWPDTPNHSNFPSTILRPGQDFNEAIEYNFYQIPDNY